jgi:hypothetical protein
MVAVQGPVLWPTLAYLSIYLTAWTRVLLEKSIVAQLVKKFPTFYGAKRSVTVGCEVLTVTMNEKCTYTNISKEGSAPILRVKE